MREATNKQEPSSTEGGQVKIGDKVWVLCEVVKVYNHQSLYIDIRHDGAVFEAKRSDCRPDEPPVIEACTKTANDQLLQSLKDYPFGEPPDSPKILDSSSEPLLLGDAVELQSKNVWRGTKGILTNWCPIKKAFWFESLDPSRKAISGWMKEQWDDEETGICRLVKIDHPNDSPKPDGSSDAINPSHYKHLPTEAIDIIEAAIAGAPSNKAAYLHGQSLKYPLRCWEKGGVEDLKKARWYLDRLIDEVGE